MEASQKVHQNTVHCAHYGNDFHRQYIRKHGRPIGVMVAKVEATTEGGNVLSFGYSLHSDYKTYNKEYGLDVAKARMNACTVDCFTENPYEYFEVPQSVYNEVDGFLNRVRRIEKKRAERKEKSFTEDFRC